jgi:hypothetical protein
MRPENLKARIFLDGGDPHETQQIMPIKAWRNSLPTGII